MLVAWGYFHQPRGVGVGGSSVSTIYRLAQALYGNFYVWSSL